VEQGDAIAPDFGSPPSVWRGTKTCDDDMLRECVRIREGQLTLPGEFCNLVNDIICFLCTD